MTGDETSDTPWRAQPTLPSEPATNQETLVHFWLEVVSAKETVVQHLTSNGQMGRVCWES